MRPPPSVPLLALALACIAPPAAGQDARACADEVQRLSEAFSLTDSNPKTSVPIAQEPGAREGASLTNAQRKQIGDLVRQARNAGERGDGDGCLRGLTEARALLRQGGIGSAQPGDAFGGTADVTGGGGSSVVSPGGAAAGLTGSGAASTGAVGRAGSMNGLTGSDTAEPGATESAPDRLSAGGSTLGGTTGGAAGGSAGGGTSGGGSGGGGSP